MDGLFHVCRAFEQEDVVHVEGNVDPVRDLEIISEELILKVCNWQSFQFLSTYILVGFGAFGT